MNIVVVQILRSGDILQTLLACIYYQQRNPMHQLSLLVRPEMCEGMLPLLNVFCKKIFFYERLHQQNHDSLVKELHSFSPSLYVNLSFCTYSSQLLGHSLLSTTPMIGSMDRQKKRFLHGRWASYVYSTVMSTHSNPFSLVDLYYELLQEHQGSSQLKDPFLIYTYIQQHLNFDTLLTTKLPPQRFHVVIHPFASNSKKSFSLSSWSFLLNFMLNQHKHLQIHLLTTEKEFSLLQQLLSSIEDSQRIQIHQDLPALSIIHLLKQASLFLGHDSYCSHLLPYSQTPAILFHLGNSRPQENAPHLRHLFIFTSSESCYPCFATDPCQNYICHFSVQDQSFLELFSFLTDSYAKNIPTINMVQHLQSFFKKDIHSKKSYFLYCTEFNELELLDLIRLDQQVISLNELMTHFQKILWALYYYDRDFSLPSPVVDSSLYGPLQHLDLLAEKALHLYQFYMNDLSVILESSLTIQQVQAPLKVSERLHDIELLLEELCLKNHYFSPLVHIFALVRVQLNSQDAAHGADHYKNISSNIMQASLYTQAFRDLISTLLPAHLRDKSSKNESSL